MTTKYYGILIASVITLLQISTLLSPSLANAKMSVFNSPHNLSASSPSKAGTAKYADETRICVFCHVPHNAIKADFNAPLWSRQLTNVALYKPYYSTTLNASPLPDRPTGTSRLCLSCHDGTIALGDFVGNKQANKGNNMIGTALLGTDLRNDHPISFEYTATLAGQSNLALPATLPKSIRLEGGKILQCTSCHNAHDNQYGKFLVMDNSAEGSPLCVTCHKPPGWEKSSHNPQNTSLPSSSGALTKGCLSCHANHNAAQNSQLLAAVGSSTCTTSDCHKNLKDVSSRTYSHLSLQLQGQHDEAEKIPVKERHADCVDCHNPHQSSNQTASAATISGALAGVRVDDTKKIASHEYEICFKCHSGPNASSFCGVMGGSPPNRMKMEYDQNKRFALNAVSAHPVMRQRTGNGASLKKDQQQQATMLTITCSDCHGGDVAGDPKGPHGSSYAHILSERYEMPPSNQILPYNETNFALCFKCHDSSYVMGSANNIGTAFNNLGVNEHFKHVNDRLIPCYACHDSHGISFESGGTPQNNAHLINFNKDYAYNPPTGAEPIYTSTGSGVGNCTVKCHPTGGGIRSYRAN